MTVVKEWHGGALHDAEPGRAISGAIKDVSARRF